MDERKDEMGKRRGGTVGRKRKEEKKNAAGGTVQELRRNETFDGRAYSREETAYGRRGTELGREAA